MTTTTIINSMSVKPFSFTTSAPSGLLQDDPVPAPRRNGSIIAWPAISTRPPQRNPYAMLLRTEDGGNALSLRDPHRPAPAALRAACLPTCALQLRPLAD